MNTRDYIIWAIFALVCAVIVIISKRIKKQTEEKGIETSGVISRIDVDIDPEDPGLTYYARYRTLEGEEIEGVISNPSDDLEEGMQVRLKYHPQYKMNARIIYDKDTESNE